MFTESVKDRIIVAAFDLAAEKKWSRVGMFEIAAKAGISLDQMREQFSHKEDIIAGFSRKMDNAVLRKMSAEGLGDESPRERLFDVMMTRFDIMKPYRGALRNIAGDCSAIGLRTLCQVFSSSYWTLSAAGISADGAGGAVRRAGVMKVVARVFPVWLKDEEEGLPKTMAALDKHLRSGEALIKGVKNLKSASCALLCSLVGRRGSGRAGQGDSDAGAASGGGTPVGTGSTATYTPRGPEPEGGAI